MYKAVAAIIFAANALPAWAQMTPEGLWRNIDDKTGEAKAMINDARQALPGDDPITITLGADKGYDAREFIDALQEMNVLPHVAQNKSGRQSAVPDRIAGSEGYAISQQ